MRSASTAMGMTSGSSEKMRTMGSASTKVQTPIAATTTKAARLEKWYPVRMRSYFLAP